MGFTLGASFHSKHSTGTHIPHPNTHTHMGMQPYPHVATRRIYIPCFSKIYLHPPLITSAFPVAQTVKNPPATWV